MLDSAVMAPLLLAIVAVVVGGGLGFFLGRKALAEKAEVARKDAERIVASAQAEQKDVVLQATKEAMRLRSTVEDEVRERRQEVQRQERRIAQKEEQLDRKTEAVDRRERALTTKEKDLETARSEVDEIKRS